METTRIEKNGTLSLAGLSMTPAEWLKFNYNLEIGNRIVATQGTGKIVAVKITDNIGHFRTNYPVVISVDFVSHTEWITIEAIHGF